MTVTELRRAWRFDEAEKVIKEELGGPTAEVELGRIAFQRGRFQLASEHFERALTLAPDDEQALAWRVATLSRRRRYSEARAEADAALAAAPDAHLVRLARARVADDETGDVQYLLDEIETILAGDPNHLEALEWRIGTLGDLTRYDDADEAARDAVRCHPDAAELYRMWGLALADAGRLPEAIEQVEHALAIQPDYVDAKNTLSAQLGDTGRHDEAVAFAERAVLANPDVSRLRAAWGTALKAVEDLHGALGQYEKAVALDPDIDSYHSLIAGTLRGLDRREDALDVLRAALERLPDKVGLLLELAWWHHWVDDLDAAIAASAEALAADPSDSAAIICHAVMLREANRFPEAAAVLEAGIEQRPRDAYLPSSLGWVHAYADRDQEALDCFQRAAALRPNSADFVDDVCTALRWLHRDAEADRVLTAACERLADPATLVEEKAQLRWRAGQTQDALALYQQINEKTPRYVSAWNRRINLLRNERRLVEAEQVARRAIASNPFSVDLRISLAWVLRARGDEVGPITSLRAACADLPHSTALSRRLAGFLRLAGEFDQAWDVLSRLPDTAAVEQDRITLRQEAHDHQRAIDLATAAAARYPHDARFPIALGDLRSDLDDDEAALAAYESALAIEETSQTALRGKAKCLRRLRRFTEAEHFLIAEIARLPNYPHIRMELAWTYGHMERRADGIAQFEHALKISPRDTVLLRNYANALSLAGRWQDAEQVLTDAVEQFPRDAWLLDARGALCDELNQREEALAWFDKALTIVPKTNFWALVAKSATLRSLGRFDQAERLLAPALERKTVPVGLIVEWGWVLRDRGQLTRARQAFERALALTVGRRDRADVLHCLGWVAFSANDFQQATTHYRDALATHPPSLDAKIGLAWTLLREGQPNGEAEAEQLCLEVLDRRPRRHLAHTCLGVLYAHQNNLPQAEHHLRRAIEIDPYGGSYVDLGALFVQMDRFEEAEELLRKALDRDWYDSQAHIELGGLYLQRDFDADEAGPDARQAAQHFRQALVIDPSRGAAAIGLSLALTRSPGDLLTAERVLRDALERNDCDQPRWQLLVALARLLIGRGDATQRRDLYLEALSIAQQAIELAVEQADPHYVAGVAAYKAGESGPEAQARPFYRRRALRHFRRCLGHDPRHTEARRVMNLAEQSLAITRTSLVGSVLMMFVATVMLVVMWVGFFLTDKVSTVVISTLTPVLVGLVALGFVLPFLVRLKLPGGVEADLSASLNQVSSGPTGEVSIGPGRLVGRSSDGSGGGSPLSTGPRGELPRLG